MLLDAFDQKKRRERGFMWTSGALGVRLNCHPSDVVRYCLHIISSSLTHSQGSACGATPAHQLTSWMIVHRSARANQMVEYSEGLDDDLELVRDVLVQPDVRGCAHTHHAAVAAARQHRTHTSIIGGALVTHCRSRHA